MSAQMDEFIKKTLKNLEKANYIRPEEIPAIELYMDQVTTFMDSHLSSSKRSDEDKILTKTMINNYTKNNLLPPSVKKKYSKNHILIMIFIYYFKGFLSISDIQCLLTPLVTEHFADSASLPLSELYEKVFFLENEQLQNLRQDITNKYEISKTIFTEETDQDFLQCFSFISLLSFDVYMKKQLIEKSIDQLLKPKAEQKPEKSSEKKSKKEP